MEQQELNLLSHRKWQKKKFVKQLFFKRLNIREHRTQSLREKKQNSVYMLWWRKEYTSNLTDPLHWGDEAENVMKSRWLEFTGKNSREFDTGKKNTPKSRRVPSENFACRSTFEHELTTQGKKNHLTGLEKTVHSTYQARKSACSLQT